MTSVDKEKAAPGTYDIEVLNTANTNSIMTYGFPDRDQTRVGIGYISFETPEGESREIYINSDNNTLDGVASAINASRSGVTAQVINDGTDSDEPWKLLITSEHTGWKNNFEWPSFNMLDGELEFDHDRLREGKSATLRINGHPVMVDENKVKDLIPGLTFDLKNAEPGKRITIEVQPDIEKVGAKVKNFVEKMNGVLGYIQSQHSRGADSRKDKTKLFQGDVGLQAIESRMRSVIQQAHSRNPSQIEALRDVGIVFNRNGTLDFDEKKFQSKLESNFDEVAHMFGGSGGLGGFAGEMMRLVDGVVRSGDGMLSQREKAATDQANKLQGEKDRATARAEERMQKVKAQFGRVEAALQNMQNMGGVAQGAGG